LIRKIHVTPLNKSISKLLAISSVGLILLTWTVLPGAASSASAAESQAKPADGNANPQTLVIKEFDTRVKDYMALHKKMESAVPAPKPTGSPEKIDVGKDSLLLAIRGARRDAKPGDIFGSAAPLFRQWIKEDAKNRTTRDVHAAKEEVPKRDPVTVNSEYPEKAPVATVPPLLLKRLPPLPEGLEYRFMGRDLILYDAKANLIVDILNDADPAVLRNKTNPNVKTNPNPVRNK